MCTLVFRCIYTPAFLNDYEEVVGFNFDVNDMCQFSGLSYNYAMYLQDRVQTDSNGTLFYLDTKPA